MATAFAPPPSAPQQPMPQAPAQVPTAPPARMDLNAGEFILPQQAGPSQGKPQWPAYTGPSATAQMPAQPAQFQQPQQQQFVAPAQQPQQPAQWGFQPMPAAPQQPQYQQPQQFQPQPQYPPQQPAAPAQPPAHAPAILGPDPRFPGAMPVQFNDGLSLAGPVGGLPSGSGAAMPQAPAATPSGALNTQPPPQQQQFAPFAGTPTTVIRDSLVRQGMPVGYYQSDEQLLADLGESLNEIQSLRAQAAYGLEAMERERRAQGGAQQQPAAPAAPAAQQPATQAANQPPEWRPEWQNLVRLDERTGVFVPVDPAVSPLIAQKANEYREWQRRTSEALLRDPVGTIRQAGLDQYLKQERDSLKAELRQEMEAEQRQRQSQQRVAEFMQANRGVLYQLDQQGNILVNPITRQPVLTPRGQAAAHYAGQIRQQFEATYGIEPDQSHVLEQVQMRLAADEARGMFGPPQQPQQVGYLPQGQPMQPAPPTNDQLKDQVIQRAIAMNGAQYQPNQLGTIATAATNAAIPQNPRLTFAQQLTQAAIEKGLLPPNYR